MGKKQFLIEMNTQMRGGKFFKGEVRSSTDKTAFCTCSQIRRSTRHVVDSYSENTWSRRGYVRRRGTAER